MIFFWTFCSAFCLILLVASTVAQWAVRFRIRRPSFVWLRCLPLDDILSCRCENMFKCSRRDGGRLLNKTLDGSRFHSRGNRSNWVSLVWKLPRRPLFRNYLDNEEAALAQTQPAPSSTQCPSTAKVASSLDTGIFVVWNCKFHDRLQDSNKFRVHGKLFSSDLTDTKPSDSSGL